MFKFLMVLVVGLGSALGMAGTSLAAGNGIDKYELPVKEKDAKLNSAQLEKKAELTSKGLEVDVQQLESGFTVISSYEKPEIIDVTPDSQIGTISVDQDIYYGYTHVGHITGTIEASFSSSYASIRSHSLYAGATATERSQYYSPATGNPAKLYYKFDKNVSNGGMNGSGEVPFNTIFYVYANGSLDFWSDASMRD